MSILRFSDGMNINTAGSYRVILKSDGYYVVGEGMCIPVNSRKSGEEVIADMTDDAQMTFNALSIGDYFQYEHVPGRLYRKRTKGTAAIVGNPCEETGRTWVRFTKNTNITRVIR